MNTASGVQALYSNTQGARNTASGYRALYLNTTGNMNTASGDQALYNNSTSVGNTIYGDLANGSFTGEIGIGTDSPNDALDVVGDIDATGCVQTGDSNTIGGTCVSDARMKKNIRYLSQSLDKIVSLRPARFQWREEASPKQKLSAKARVETGLIAQDVEKVLPHLVKTGKKGIKKVVYDIELQMHMIQAIKELKVNNDTLKAALKSEKEKTRVALQTMEQKLALLEHNGTRKHAFNDTPLAAGALTAVSGSSGGGGVGAGLAGLARDLHAWVGGRQYMGRRRHYSGGVVQVHLLAAGELLLLHHGLHLLHQVRDLIQQAVQLALTIRDRQDLHPLCGEHHHRRRAHLGAAAAAAADPLARVDLGPAPARAARAHALTLSLATASA